VKSFRSKAFFVFTCLSLGASTAPLIAAQVGSIQQAAITAAPPVKSDVVKKDYLRPSAVPFPSDNPFTPEKLKLGKALYFDTRLSNSGSQSCASCHSPSLGWGDGLAKGVGDGMKQLKRRSPTILNAAWGSIFMWDGRAASLEQQALGPIQAEAEMNMSLAKLLERLTSISEYRPLFEAAFPGEGMNATTIAKAIATFERTVVSGWAPFDDWISGNKNAISSSAARGFDLFVGKAGCAECHSGWNFTDDSFHDIGMSDADIGRAEFNKISVKMQHAFKTPGLRDITLRGPYMHNGSLATLEAVVDHYDQGGVARTSRSDLIRPLGLTAQEKADLVAFMKTLTGEAISMQLPVLPR
jgi:cytochrome c peroxidase